MRPAQLNRSGWGENPLDYSAIIGFNVPAERAGISGSVFYLSRQKLFMSGKSMTTREKAKRLPILYLIVAWKLGKGLLLIIASFGILLLAGKDLGGGLDQLLRWIHIDPEHEFFVNIGQWLDQISPANFRMWELGTLLYGLLMVAVGVGMACRTHWAIWLAIGEYSFFIPIEVFKLIRPRAGGHTAHAKSHLFTNPHLDMLVLLLVNMALVGYLIKNRNKLFKHPS